MRLIETIKRAGMDAVEASNPVQIIFGEVTSIDPLEVIVDQRFSLTADFLIIPESLTYYAVDLSHSHQYMDSDDGGTRNRTTDESLNEPVVIRRGFMMGDRLLMLRMQGGQKYLILDRIIEDGAVMG